MMVKHKDQPKPLVHDLGHYLKHCVVLEKFCEYLASAQHHPCQEGFKSFPAFQELKSRVGLDRHFFQERNLDDKSFVFGTEYIEWIILLYSIYREAQNNLSFMCTT